MNGRGADPRSYVRVEGELAYVTLTRGTVSVIDAPDAADVGKHLWHLDSVGYATRNIKTDDKRTLLRLHRFLLNPDPGYEVDHIDGDRLNNRRSNLRLCSRAENARNSKPQLTLNGLPVSCRYKGVTISRGKYAASIKANSKKRSLGYFCDPAEAARAYDRAARIHFGQHARTNF